MAAVTICTDFGAPKNKVCHFIIKSIVSPSNCHEVMGLDAMILVFWMLSFKPTFEWGVSNSFYLIVKSCICSGLCLVLISSLHKHNTVERTVESSFRRLGSIEGGIGIFSESFFLSEPRFPRLWIVNTNDCLVFFARLFWGPNERGKLLAHHKTLYKC